jgi:hypothetical protein
MMNFVRILRKLLLSLVLIVSSFLFANAGIVVLNGLTHEYQVQPGESYRGTIQIQNVEDKEKSVKVYQTDYWFSYTGESRHDSAGTIRRSNANWVTYNPELMTLAANQTTAIEFEIKVPADDSLKGTYWSVIMVEGILPPDTASHKNGVTINTSVRYAIQIITNIGETGKSDMQFLGLQMAKENDKNILNVMVANTGERLLRPKISLELFDESGNSVGVTNAESKKTYPGTSVKIVLPLEGIKPGKYTGVLVADCDEDHIFGTNVSLEVG